MKDENKRIIVGVAAIMFYPLGLAFDLAVWGTKVFELEILGHQSDGRLILFLIFSAVLKFIAYGSVISLISMKKDNQAEEETTA
jgi:hypothetical protein